MWPPFTASRPPWLMPRRTAPKPHQQPSAHRQEQGQPKRPNLPEDAPESLADDTDTAPTALTINTITERLRARTGAASEVARNGDRSSPFARSSDFQPSEEQSFSSPRRADTSVFYTKRLHIDGAEPAPKYGGFKLPPCTSFRFALKVIFVC